jgi:hypothetical protein
MEVNRAADEKKISTAGKLCNSQQPGKLSRWSIVG